MLSTHFDMKDLGEASYVLGIKILRDRANGVLKLSQRAYIERILKRFNMHNFKSTKAPIVKGDKFSKAQCPQNDDEREEMKTIPYSSVVGSLMYAQVCTRPDIAFVVGMLGRYLSNPGSQHWKAAKKVLRRSCILKKCQADTYNILNYGGRLLLSLRTLGVFLAPKHIDVKFYLVKEKVAESLIDIEHMSTKKGKSSLTRNSRTIKHWRSFLNTRKEQEMAFHGVNQGGKAIKLTEMRIKMWLPLLLLLSLLCPCTQQPIPPHCPDKCGKVSVPHPFGIGNVKCARDDKFLLHCNNGQPWLLDSIPVRHISLDGTVTVTMKTQRQCYNDSMKAKKFYHFLSAFNIAGANLSALLNYLEPSEVILDWVAGNETCQAARNCSGTYACGENTDCLDSTNGPGYRCYCNLVNWLR
ncbi:Retrovirus-related Pol polyprotein from transposon TNT 1-94 [Vitis vinifera]|uniref:Retrovirus-related Pol polyprotein from transposon TNT 1-94 n=1 Tax=Vitis vinifera TaxID=29760 RepID=A0A438CA90_VITVI|nr:Retrovirus-related Pol polyprotein from transposon TNT 1-94 [Vitis vinifera]